MTIQPDHSTLNLARIEAKMLDWARAGRQVYKMEASGDQPVRPSDIIHLAEYPDLAHAWDKGGDDLDGPVALTDEPGGDAMRSAPPYSRVLRDGGSPAPGHLDQWERALDALSDEGEWVDG